MSSRHQDYSNPPPYPPNMMSNGKNTHYSRGSYDHSSRDNLLNGSQDRYMAPEYSRSMGKYRGMNGGMNGNPNQISNSLNRENSSSYNHHSHHKSNSNHSPALDLVKSQQSDLRDGHDFGMNGIGRDREHSGMRNNIHG